MATQVPQEDWRDRQVKRADEAQAKPFREKMKAKYRACRTADELRALSRECWKVRDAAVRQANKYCNMTIHGTHLYDSWDYLAADAEDWAKEFFRKARRLDAGEPIEAVLPHVKRSA